MNAHRTFRAGHRRRLEIALGIALVLALLSIATFPPLEPRRVQADEAGLEEIVLPDRIVIPDPPREVAPPRILTLSLDPDEPEDVFPETAVDPEDPLPPPPPPSSWETFVVFDRAPRPVHVVLPEYPEIARKAGIEAEVRCLVTVGPDGRVREVVVISDTPALFNEPAVEALRLWRFEPAQQGGSPVAARVVIPYRFSLRR